MRKIQRKNYSEEFRKKVLAAGFGTQESVIMTAHRFGVNRDTVAGWVHRHHQSENQGKSVGFASSKKKSMGKWKSYANCLAKAVRPVMNGLITG